MYAPSNPSAGLSCLLYRLRPAMPSRPASSTSKAAFLHMAATSPTRRFAQRAASVSIAVNQRALYSAAPVAAANAHKQSQSHSQKSGANLVGANSLSRRIPRGAWDSHMHIIDPQLYSLTSDAAYQPSTFSLDDAISFESSIGISNVVLVQPSVYGYDNSCLLDSLRKLGSRRARGVVAFDPEAVSDAQLNEWHQLGVRGARFNIKSIDAHVKSERLARFLQIYADRIKHLDWVLQLYVPMSYMPVLEAIVPSLGVKVCIDHFGHPDIEDDTKQDPYQLVGFPSLVRMLESSNTYVKLSAPYRMSQLQGYRDLEPFARELIHLKGHSQVVFGSDWPHTRFEGLDIRPWIATVFDWCGNDDQLVERLFKGNAEDLWEVTSR